MCSCNYHFYSYLIKKKKMCSCNYYGSYLSKKQKTITVHGSRSENISSTSQFKLRFFIQSTTIEIAQISKLNTKIDTPSPIYPHSFKQNLSLRSHILYLGLHKKIIDHPIRQPNTTSLKAHIRANTCQSQSKLQKPTYYYITAKKEDNQFRIKS
jgi:hypothetical protein